MMKPGDIAGQTGVPAHLAKLRGRPVAQICNEFDIDDALVQKITEATSPENFLRYLIADGRLFDAMRFLAHALPKREAVWWACQCARTTFKDTITQSAAASIAAAEAWVYQPAEENRRKAAAVVQALKKIDTNTAWAVSAASWSSAPHPSGGGAPPPAPALPNELTGRAVTVSLTLSAVALGPAQLQDTLRKFVEKGIELAGAQPG